MALNKIFTARYYAKNTGFFLVIFYLFFGIVPGGQLPSYHLSLIKGFTGSLDFLALVCFAWLLYNLKCIAFVINVLSSREHTFLYGTIGILEAGAKWRNWFLIHLGVYAPVLIYSVIAAAVAFHQHFTVAACIIIVFNIVMLIAPLWVYDHKMKHPGTVSFFARWQLWLNRRVRKPFWAFYGYELLNNNIRAFAISKVVSAVTIIITCSLMGSDYDVRVLLTGFLVCILCQCILVYDHRRFDDLYLAMTPQLSIPLWKRFLQIVLLYSVLLLPESILLVYKTWYTADPLHWLLLMATGVAAMTLLRCLLYFPRLDQDKYFRWVLILIAGLLFMGLARLYWYSVLLLLMPAYIIFYYRYYRYEAPLEKVD